MQRSHAAGGRDDDEVVQCYLEAGEPPRVLEAFHRVMLAANTGRDVELDPPDAAFMVRVVTSHDWRRVTDLRKSSSASPLATSGPTA